MGTNGNRHDPSLINRLVDIQLSEAQIRAVLDERAKTLARTQEDEAEQGTFKQFVTFHLGGELYGLDVELIEEIQPIKDLTLIPCTPDFVVGAVNVRGSILPVIDIKSFFGLAGSDLHPTSKIIVIKHEDVRMGILSDQVDEVLNISSDDIRPQIATLSGTAEEFIDGVTEESVIMLDMAALATDQRMIVHEDV